MSFVRGSALQGFSELVDELGADPWTLLEEARIDPVAVGDPEQLIGTRNVVTVMENAARVTDAPDFGRRLARGQGIEILGALGIAARSASTVGAALEAIDRHMDSYTPEVIARVDPSPDERFARFDWALKTLHATPHRQTAELGLGVSLRVFRALVDESFTPEVVLLRHQPLSDPRDYHDYFGCPVRFGTEGHGFLFARTVLDRRVSDDAAVHELAVRHLGTIALTEDPSSAAAATAVIRAMLPTGALGLEQVAVHLGVHPRSLQRQLRAEGTTYQQLVDDTRREEAERHLRDTELPLNHIAHLLGYTEQSVFSRSCVRWFEMTPSKTRAHLQARQ